MVFFLLIFELTRHVLIMFDRIQTLQSVIINALVQIPTLDYSILDQNTLSYINMWHPNIDYIV